MPQPRFCLYLICVALPALPACDDGFGLALSQLGITDGNNESAQSVRWDQGRVEIRDTIFPFGDFDRYNLGPVKAGDRLRITVDRAGMSAGLLLADGDTSVILDGLDGNAPQRPSIDFLARRDVPRLHLFVGPGHIRLPPVEILPVPTMGQYHVVVEMLDRGGPLPTPRSQTVILDFKGGTDERYFGHPIQIAPFSAAAYNDSLAGRDDAIRRNVAAQVREIYAEFDLNVITSDDLPPDGPASRIYLTTPGYFQVGGTNFAGGQVRYIDFGNRDSGDVGIVSPGKYTGDDARMFGLRLGQLAAHEIGHLLGLVHQEDGLMSYNNSVALISGPVGGFFGFTDPTNAGLFPASPRMIQPTHEYLMAILGPRPGETGKGKPPRQSLKPARRARR